MEVNTDKISLIRDLCGKLYDNVIVHVKKQNEEFDGFVKSIKGEYLLVLYDGIEIACHINEIKPYLRPLSSMTEKEINEIEIIIDRLNKNHILVYELFDFFNSHYIDIRNFIDKGLALKASENMYD